MGDAVAEEHQRIPVLQFDGGKHGFERDGRRRWLLRLGPKKQNAGDDSMLCKAMLTIFVFMAVSSWGDRRVNTLGDTVGLTTGYPGYGGVVGCESSDTRIPW